MGLEKDFRRHVTSYRGFVHAASNTAVRMPIRPRVTYARGLTRRYSCRSESACSRIELGTTKAGVSTFAKPLSPMPGTFGKINWNGPGEVIIPKVIATAKSARPKIFQAIAALRP